MSRNASSRGTKATATARSAIHPWRRAKNLADCCLFFLPVGGFPIASLQREWLLEFLQRLVGSVRNMLGLRLEQFINVSAVYPLRHSEFVSASRQMKPLPGICWRPGATPRQTTVEEDLQAIQDGKKKFELSDYTADQCYWFISKSDKEQRDLFFGLGGLTLMFMKPDPNTQPPDFPFPLAKLQSSPIYGEIIKQFNPVEMLAEAYSLQDAFLPQSKTLFADRFSQVPGSDRAKFILPLLSSQDFFTSTAEERNKWFDLFGVYITESPVDAGILLAACSDVQELLASVMQSMTDAGLDYPEA